MFRQIFLICIHISICICAKVRYDNYHVYSISVENIKQSKILHEIKLNSNDYDFWTSPSIGRQSDIMIPPHKLDDFGDLAKSLNLNYTVKIDNLQRLMDNENPSTMPKSFGWDAYYGLDEIYSWLDEKLIQYPDILSNHIVGKSYQNRSIRAVLLSHKEDNPWIFIETNIHAREWITSATATCLLDHLLSSTDPDIRDLAESFNWMILPVLNVDGFEYTHTTNRLWRKTRQPHSHLCYGADPNRNFDFKWMEIGASLDPCANHYAGPKPFSEPETLHLNEFVKKYLSKIKVYFAFHSYEQYFIFPYGHTTEPVKNYDILMQLANKTVEGIAKQYNTRYTYGPSITIMYPTAGMSVDWFYEKMGINISYTVEFRDKGEYGFLLPASQIKENCNEVIDGLVAFVREARILGQI